MKQEDHEIENFISYDKVVVSGAGEVHQVGCRRNIRCWSSYQDRLHAVGAVGAGAVTQVGCSKSIRS